MTLGTLQGPTGAINLNSNTQVFGDFHVTGTLVGVNANFSGNVNATTINGQSDRNAKERFTAVNGREILDRLAKIPIEEWNYKLDSATRHIGPMAQDFHAAFEVGTDDKHIATVDADGVALAAIQGLNQLLGEKETALSALRADLQKMQAQITALQQAVKVGDARLKSRARPAHKAAVRAEQSQEP